MKCFLGAVVVFAMSTGCGGPEVEQTHEASSESALPPVKNNECRVLCDTGPNTGASGQTTVPTLQECTAFAYSVCDASAGGAGYFWYNGQQYAW
ncbi:hypothetical protein LZ198_25870 [Myxococcus sp. K15C18031901]|uniref:hypothetical protein n=1 Tax=Myxococcus dinghuensis TaxID=2906761 RepID=UPI0020A82C95|nr:hypothetical protein [Myxococcus dinghuensis]MCP3102303.1 hypothetical protein [Myxococcus dinghuensis]